jgi:hypothetical protein
MTPEFIPGLDLNEAFYWEAVRPILDAHFPGLKHTACLIGWGSDVLGYDTPVSRDHGWGPRLILFLTEDGFETNQPLVNEALRQNLPVRFRGYSTNYGVPNPDDSGVRPVREIESGPVEHMVQIETISGFWGRSLGIDPYRDPSPAEWLTFSEQELCSLKAGRVFFDGVGLEDVRRRFAYYPQDVWLYVLAAEWALISQEEAFVGRTVDLGDEFGSKVIAARQVERLMRICFLLEKTYAPYSKWFGTAFQHLRISQDMGPLLQEAAAANTYSEREKWLAQAYSLAVEVQNGLKITPAMDPRTRTYSGWHLFNAGQGEVSLDDPRNTRPHQVIFAGRIADAVYAAIRDPQVLALTPNLGSVNQFMVPSSDALQNTTFTAALKDHFGVRRP